MTWFGLEPSVQLLVGFQRWSSTRSTDGPEVPVDIVGPGQLLCE